MRGRGTLASQSIVASMQEPRIGSERFRTFVSTLHTVPQATGPIMAATGWAAIPGSAAADEVASFADPTAVGVLLTEAVQILTVSADHMGGLQRVLTSPVMTFAPWTLARATLELGSTVLWLLDPTIGAVQRVNRGISLRCQSLNDQVRWLRNLRSQPELAQELIGMASAQIEKLVQYASARNIDVIRARGSEIVGFGERVPPMTTLTRLAGVEENYRLFSGVAHGRPWATSVTGFDRVGEENRLTQDLRVESALTIVLSALEIWLRATFALFVYAGWDTKRWAGVCDPLLDEAEINDRARPWRQP